MTEKKEPTFASQLISFVLMLAISGYIINIAISSPDFLLDYELSQHGKIAPGTVKSVVRTFETARGGTGKKPYEVYDHIIAFEGREQNFRAMRPLGMGQVLDIYYSSVDPSHARIKEPHHPFPSLTDVLLQPTTAALLGLGAFAAFGAFFSLLVGLFKKIRLQRMRDNQTV